MFHVKQFTKLAEFCRMNNLEYDEIKNSQFDLFCDMMIEKNKVMNLTGITEPTEIEIVHYIDSVAAASVMYELLGQNKNFSVIDMGTGAGFPGMPLKIMMPEAEFVLADALNKRINFLNEVINAAGLQKVTAIQGRAEELGQSELRESFDFCVSRAVADMSVLLEYCLPMVKVGGYAILYKSGEYASELESAKTALEVLGGEIKTVKEFSLPGSDINRSLIVIYKGKAAPDKYPRRPGKPSKSPITNK